MARRIAPPRKTSWLPLAGMAALGVVIGWCGYQLHAARHESNEEPDTAAKTPAACPGEPSLSTGCCPAPGDLAGSDDSLAPPEKGAASAKVNSTPAPGAAPAGMTWIPGGVFWRGSATKGHRDARPWHQVEVDGFWIDVAPVTNAQFEKFVAATNYVTVAERTPRAEDFPGAPPENLVAGSVVFSPPAAAVPLDNHYRWWKYEPGANWRHPTGTDSDLRDRAKHPVVHVAYEDALAYCKWAGKRLPTEAEFEFAARGGLDRNTFAWGNEFRPTGRWMANIWQGKFPIENTADDGFTATAPVGSFPANRFGLADVAGNVWEWCSDWYRHDYYRTLATGPQPVKNPQGPADSFDPAEPAVAKRVMRGGSFLCTDQYCTAYEVGARGKGAPDTGTNHLGFRCVK